MPGADTFTLAAGGDVAAQEAMALASLGGHVDPRTAPELDIILAYMWANMAHTNGSLTIRPLRLDLLLAMAVRFLANVPHRSRVFYVDALALLFELAAEDDARAAGMIPSLLDTLTTAFGVVGRDAMIGEANALAAARITAATDVVPPPHVHATVTVH